jgi:hypothetical protein
LESGGHRSADQPLHHLPQQFRTDGCRFWAAAVAVVGDDLECDLPDGRLVLLGHVSLDLVEEKAGRLQLPPDEFGVA